MKKARVLIVDDAALIRRLVSDALAADPNIEVVGGAGNGRLGLQMIEQTSPDLVTLDVEMPEMGGIETLREIRKRYPRLPVIMFSVLTERGCADTLEALSLGASDYVAKPATAGGREAAQQRIRDDLVPRIKSLCRINQAPHAPAPAAPPVARVADAARRGADAEIRVVALAASTGGPNALQEVLTHLPASFPVPIVVVQHMPQTFTRFLAERLNQQSALSVVEAADAQPLQPGTVYIARGDYHLRVKRLGAHIVTALDQEPPVNSHRPAADVLLQSVAELYGGHALVVIMTGTGEDALHGCEAIVRAGGHVLVQDEATSIAWDMAGRVQRAGLAELALPLADVGPELRRRTTTAAAAAAPRSAAARA
jgi:two-component system, chemotaxis family, protein-glutamate methylesterase/glutaminase